MAHARADFVRFITRQYMYFLKEDWCELTGRIRAMFPQARFFAESEDDKREIGQIRLELKKSGSMQLIDSNHSLYGHMLRIWRRSESPEICSHPYSHWTEVLINPGEWQPVWRPSQATFMPQRQNPPHESFSFYVSKIYRSLISDPLAAEPLPSLKDNEVLCLGESSFNGTYAPGDDRMKKLLQRVARAIDKMTDNRYVALEPADWSVRLTIEKGGVMHIAPDAKRWAMAHPRHLLGPNLAKPIEWRDRATAASAS